MTQTITMTTKGTFTLPAVLREKIGVNKKGDQLEITYQEDTGNLVISKPKSLDQIHAILSPYTNVVKPLDDVSKFYSNRKPRI
jgi:bifunctional DNA-binding transcriptional regulator/antitoxin component of YhaV-PrlF toxin-antitoxin module